MKHFLIIIVLVLLSHSLYADSDIDGQTVSFTKLMNAMVSATRNTTFENVKVRYDMAIDKQGMDKRFAEAKDELVVSQRIRLLNCDFDMDYWLVLRKMTFNDYVSIFNCSHIKAILVGCDFKKTFRVYSNDMDFIDFDTCTFEHGFKFGRNDCKDRLKFTFCNFNVNEGLIHDVPNELDMEARIFFLSNKLNPLDLTVQHCTFNVPDKLKGDPQYFIEMRESGFSNLNFIYNTVNCNFDLSQSTVANTFMTYNCSFGGKLIMDAFNINPINTRVQWNSVKGNKLAVIDAVTKSIYHGERSDSLYDEFLFNSLISCYANFYNAFKAQGNRIAANECYIEWKNIETQYLKNTYKRTGDRKTFFNYVMDIFLRTFCDYGTNPLKAIQIAFYVLLSFAAIYFFFPYRIKTFQRRTVFDQLKLYGRYLASPKSLLEIEDSGFAEHKDPPSYTEYIKFLDSSDKKIPWYFHIFGRPIYFLEKLKDKPSMLFYRMIDWFPDEWESLKPAKKILATILYGFVFIFTVIWFLTIHILDSIMLSLNVFSTLGFGQIPVRGVPRYLTVIEGFIGWFLLSIFSVSLISQVIQ